jgi:hypothetical protein
MDNQITTTETTTQKTSETIPVQSTTSRSVIIASDQHNPLIRKRNSLGYYLTLGMRGLLGSKKGTFSILVLLITTAALFTTKISGMEFCSAITVIAGIYAAGATATDISNIRNQ